ncbi:hypothetical protein E4T47_08478 [Aureobasidium subglaciale]|nr:hypothetical protein E4T47_08478 [Aureobasidium subglaciale]
MANIEQLDALLQSLQALKPPGATKGKISAVTTLCVENVQSESAITQKLYRHLKRTPGTHKLGVLYVVDSVTRQWIEKARQSSQDLTGTAAPEGTFAAGVQRVTELLPSLVDDTVQKAPSDHKAKVESLVQIWERGNTFPASTLAEIKKKLAEPVPQYVASITPPGSPPLSMLVSLGLRQAPPPPAAPAVQAPSDASSILAALSLLQPMPAQAVVAPPVPPILPVQAQPPAPPQDLAAIMAGATRGYQGQVQQAPPAPYGYPPPPPQQAYGQPYPPPTPIAHMPPAYPPQYHTPAPYQQAPPQPPTPSANAGPASFLPPHILNNPQILPNVLQLIQGLSQEGIPQEQWGAVLTALYPPPQQAPPAQDAYPSRSEERGHYRDRSMDRAGGRNRSRSPGPPRNNNSNNNVNNNNNAGRRASPVYGTYDASVAQSAQDHAASQSDRRGGRGRGRGGRNDYRQRTPPSARTPQSDDTLVPRNINPKWTDMDNSMLPGHIKVLSRTLFVGGANGNEAELRAIFGRYGPVQTCIANEDKRHAFVKMCNRQDAVAAKTAMETTRDPDVLAKARQTKWGVGFGPRECCDYSNGVSVIPIDTLTEADHKWMLTAEFGGTGGRPIESGLVVEEPDIEIGAGVSSKAMSRRVGPDGGSNRGGGGGRRGRGGGGGRFNQPESHAPRPEPVTIAPPPPVPGFGFMVPGMPQFR